MTTYIRVQPGNLGNQMFRYMLAQAIADQVPNTKVLGYHMPEWGLVSSEDAPQWQDPFVLPPRHRIDINEAIRRLNTGKNDGIDIQAYAQRLDYFGHKLARFRAVFSSNINGTRISDDEIAINIRAGDILAGIHHDYFPLPIGFYQRLIESLSLRPVFVGQLEDNWYTDTLHQTFPNARFLKHDTALEDFQTVRFSRHKVVAISTFSWLAAWLSPADCVIHYPLAGLLNPEQRPQINLAPHEDLRYRFYKFPLFHYAGNESDIKALSLRDY